MSAKSRPTPFAMQGTNGMMNYPPLHRGWSGRIWSGVRRRVERTSVHGKEAYVELKFCPNVELIHVVRRFVSNFYERLLADADATSRLALATHELLENAVKFASDGESTIRIGVTKERGLSHVTIRTWNRSSAENIATIEKMVDEMSAAQDLFAYYQTVMRKNAKKREGSRLGLARICAEAEMAIDCQIFQDEVCIMARTQVRTESPS